MPVVWSAAPLPLRDYPCPSETGIPMTPPSPYRERVVYRSTLQTAVSFVTVTTLWLAARGVVGCPPPHCREGFRHGSASGPHACFPSHRPTPGRVPHLERSTYALLGAHWVGTVPPMPGLLQVVCSIPPHRTGLAPFRASGSPPYGLSLRHPLFHPHRWVLTSLLRRNLLRPYPSAAFLRHVAGFPDLGLLRRLCPTSSISRRLANSIAGELDAVPKFT